MIERLSFRRLLGLQRNDTVPDEKMIWYFREKLREKGIMERLFDRFYYFLMDKGVMAHSGNRVDASIVVVLKQLVPTISMGIRRIAAHRSKRP